MSVQVKYETRSTANGGRDGRTKSEDGKFDLQLSIPKELGGPGGDGTNPEQLLSLAYSACFLGAMKFVASQGGPKVAAETTVTTTVGMGPRDAGGFGFAISLDISLPGLTKEEATALAEKAHQVCPFSNATRNNVDVKLNIL